ncbi:type 4a pilus biogenesis protein PilO [Syntrophotalea acetylenica]|uniref:type 4a pilus biogenesis protein PilO n=1 Tax=Syntrophotalea acetylenica TaxID=29542 RepID=UPI002A3628BE|nr:type 4a pilus biogenesis protein PilO [Syntrophotalea acetylenica]MDY0262698.1 type 4a pilus biogenesis protein PilO [Syntrophotalea acetylenica]
MALGLEKISKLKLYQQLIVLGVIVLLVAAAFVFGVYRPMLQELKDLDNEYARVESKLLEDQRIASNLPAFRAEFEKLQAQLNEALAELPNQKEIPSLLTSIAGLAREEGLDVLSFKPKAEQVKGFYAEVPVDLELQGAYHEVAMFFYKIGNLARIVNINNLYMDKARMAAGRNVLSIKCLATTFRFVENAPEPGNRKGKKRK